MSEVDFTDKDYTKADVEKLINDVLRDPRVVNRLVEEHVFMAIAENENEHEWIPGPAQGTWVCKKCGIDNIEADNQGQIFCDGAKDE